MTAGWVAGCTAGVAQPSLPRSLPRLWTAAFGAQPHAGHPWASASLILILGAASGAQPRARALRGNTRRSRVSAVLRQAQNRGLDPKRLLGALRESGIGRPRQVPVLSPAALTTANSTDAALLVLEQRRQAVERGDPGLRPVVLRRREYRMPLVVKYHKPAGVMATMRNMRAPGAEDLRSVVSAAGDRFELDLYHPVGRFATGSSGLLLWSRNGKLTRELTSLARGVVHEFEVEVYGVVDEQQLRASLHAGVRVGFPGFEETRYADLREARVLPDSPLQDMRSRAVIATRDSASQVKKLLSACGCKVAKLKRTRVGAFSLGDIEEGGLAAPTEAEEEWACRLGELPETELPSAFLPAAQGSVSTAVAAH
mmetsp:Transcript_97604/g.276122  ORF Transcript_97604/g.276122 Transcript_97604/m.276122 type:complete len:369 (+) Transcript_97604:56-1162(+)|eukprot:CAMPEP_0168397176 /NCGR_PEP_ID=MMETSP0228-20121227/20930_1 /TAXON_ID=133427 /ORGANISM="Protoceratium reticulatum, Strain CCCM 535 (=CCMP 1889)" /LENGTH=368 /DNA_ID=CAMNT_0008410643 /DNA_START=25 /DNA_END=1131 /DNA_ORIENTATION=+